MSKQKSVFQFAHKQNSSYGCGRFGVVFSGTLVGLFLGLFLGLVLGLVLELKASADLFTPALSLLECIRKQGLSLAQHYITQMQRYEVLTRLQLIYILENKNT